jgi:hypothetical protein
MAGENTDNRSQIDSCTVVLISWRLVERNQHCVKPLPEIRSAKNSVAAGKEKAATIENALAQQRLFVGRPP